MDSQGVPTISDLVSWRLAERMRGPPPDRVLREWRDQGIAPLSLFDSFWLLENEGRQQDVGRRIGAAALAQMIGANTNPDVVATVLNRLAADGDQGVSARAGAALDALSWDWKSFY